MTQGTRRLARTAAFLVLAGAGAARAGDGPSAHGVATPPGSRVTTDLGYTEGVADEDDYVVLLEPGRTLTADAAAARGADLLPILDLLRSDGTVVATAGGTLRRARLRFTADATDAYRVRVRAADLGRRTYTLTVAVAGHVAARGDMPAPDVNGQYRFAVPARGGARITARLRYRGGAAPVPVGLTSPDGTFVEGAAAAFRWRPGSLSLTRFGIPAGAPFGEYAFAFDADPSWPAPRVTFTASTALPRETPRRGTLAAAEPWIGAAYPDVAVDGTPIVVPALHAEDPAGADFAVRVGGVPAIAEYATGGGEPTVRIFVPAGLPLGPHDVVLETSAGQVAALPQGVTVVERPTVAEVTPLAVAAVGGAEVTIRGTGFRPGRTFVRIDGETLPVHPAETTPTSIRFVAPRLDPGPRAVGVIDADTRASADAADPVDWGSWPSVGAVTPALVSLLGGETVVVDGVYFGATDRLLLETTTPGAFEEIPPTARTPERLEFVAPPRPKGRYAVVVEDPEGHRSRPVALSWFSFRDATAAFGLDTAGATDATAVGDLDGDGDADLVVTRSASGAASATSWTRILRNDGDAGFADATSDVFPAASALDDWRGDRVQVADVTQDGRPDVVLATNDRDVPAPGRSRVRILVNEPRGEGAAATDRVLRDRTADLMAPARTMSHLYGYVRRNDVDDWPALDLWVGDLDGDGSRAEIVATTDRTFENQYVACTPYCATPFAGAYTYSAYWGGTRTFRWNPAARAGLGRYEFEPNALPRRMAINVSYFYVPPGIDVPLCNPSRPCRGRFTPFTGTALAVGPIDGDAPRDVAVASNDVPTVDGAPVSALQVALRRNAAQGAPPWSGFFGLDATPALTDLGGDFRGGAVAVGAGGIVAAARGDAGGAVRVVRYVPNADASKLGTFTELQTAGGSGGADALRFTDVDGDARGDLVLLSRTVPAGATSGLRILRQLADGTFEAAYEQPVADASAEPIVGAALTVGDVDGNGLLDFLTSGSSLRAILTDR